MEDLGTRDGTLHIINCHSHLKRMDNGTSILQMKLRIKLITCSESQLVMGRTEIHVWRLCS